MPKATPAAPAETETTELAFEPGEGGTVEADPASEIPGVYDEAADPEAIDRPMVSVVVLRTGAWGKCDEAREIPADWLEVAVKSGDVRPA